MPTVTESTQIAGVYVVEPTIHGDQRGLFIETYRREWFPGAREMIQSNRANRQQGALVGLHYHLHQSRLLVHARSARLASCSTTCARAGRPTAPPTASTCRARTTSACTSRPVSRTASRR